jgi:hypothetical protein
MPNWQCYKSRSLSERFRIRILFLLKTSVVNTLKYISFIDHFKAVIYLR